MREAIVKIFIGDLNIPKLYSWKQFGDYSGNSRHCSSKMVVDCQNSRLTIWKERKIELVPGFWSQIFLFKNWVLLNRFYSWKKFQGRPKHLVSVFVKSIWRFFERNSYKSARLSDFSVQRPDFGDDRCFPDHKINENHPRITQDKHGKRLDASSLISCFSLRTRFWRFWSDFCIPS